MSDKIYIPDSVPDGYVYGTINNYYVDLFNKRQFQNESATYYRIYYSYSSGLVTESVRSFSGYNPTTYDELPVSRSVFDRPDFFNILSITLLLTVCGLWLFNLITSFVRKGGVLGGLFQDFLLYKLYFKYSYKII